MSHPPAGRWAPTVAAVAYLLTAAVRVAAQTPLQVPEVPYSAAPIINRSGVFETRFVASPAAGLDKLFEHPVEIEATARPMQVAGGTGMEVVGDFHALYPVRVQELFAVLSDYQHFVGVSPRAVESTDRATTVGPLGYHKHVQTSSAKVLGIGQSYTVVTNNYGVQLPGGALGIKWNLESSPDGRILSAMGSWYLEPVEYRGTECSYVRYFDRIVFARHPPISDTIIAFFSANDFASLVSAFCAEAVNRQARHD